MLLLIPQSTLFVVISALWIKSFRQMDAIPRSTNNSNYFRSTSFTPQSNNLTDTSMTGPLFTLRPKNPHHPLNPSASERTTLPSLPPFPASSYSASLIPTPNTPYTSPSGTPYPPPSSPLPHLSRSLPCPAALTPSHILSPFLLSNLRVLLQQSHRYLPV